MPRPTLILAPGHVGAGRGAAGAADGPPPDAAPARAGAAAGPASAVPAATGTFYVGAPGGAQPTPSQAPAVPQPVVAARPVPLPVGASPRYAYRRPLSPSEVHEVRLEVAAASAAAAVVALQPVATSAGVCVAEVMPRNNSRCHTGGVGFAAAFGTPSFDGVRVAPAVAVAAAGVTRKVSGPTSSNRVLSPELGGPGFGLQRSASLQREFPTQDGFRAVLQGRARSAAPEVAVAGCGSIFMAHAREGPDPGKARVKHASPRKVRFVADERTASAGPAAAAAAAGAHRHAPAPGFAAPAQAAAVTPRFPDIDEARRLGCWPASAGFEAESGLGRRVVVGGGGGIGNLPSGVAGARGGVGRSGGLGSLPSQQQESEAVEVQLELAVARDQGRRQALRVLVPSSATMRHVREAAARSLGVDAALVQLIAGSRASAPMGGERFVAFDDAEALGERRVLRVLGVDLPLSAGSPALLRPGAGAAREVTGKGTGGGRALVELVVSRAGGGGCVALKGVRRSWTGLDVRLALARAVGSPQLVEHGALVLQARDGTLSSLADADGVNVVIAAVHSGGQLLVTGVAELVEHHGPDVPEEEYAEAINRRKSALRRPAVTVASTGCAAGSVPPVARSHPAGSAASGTSGPCAEAGPPEAQGAAPSTATAAAAAQTSWAAPRPPGPGATAGAPSLPIAARSHTRAVPAWTEGGEKTRTRTPSSGDSPASCAVAGLEAPSQTRQLQEQQGVTFGYVCPVCGQSGLPDLGAAAGHCQEAAPQGKSEPAVQQSVGSGGVFAAASLAGQVKRAAARWLRVQHGRAEVEEAGRHDLRRSSSQAATSAGAGAAEAGGEGAEAKAAGSTSSTIGGAARGAEGGEAVWGRGGAASATPGGSVGSTAGSSTPVDQAQPVSLNERGGPTIVRLIDDASGQARTVVQNDDGTQKVFGANTAFSLIKSSDRDARQWVDALNNQELRGLVHELGARLVSTSRRYTQQRSQLADLAERGHYAYFGLAPGASEREVRAAYRRMAKRMHPDKNGGMEEAKQRFQQMKERYECLKLRARGPSGSPAGGASTTEGDETPAAWRPRPGAGEAEAAAKKAGAGEAAEAEADEEDDEGGDPPSQQSEGADESEAAEEGPLPAEGAESQESPEKTQGGGTSASRKARSRAKARAQRREAYDEDEEAASPPRRAGGAIEYDPSDRGSLDGAVWRMLGNLRRLQQSLDEVTSQLSRRSG